MESLTARALLWLAAAIIAVIASVAAVDIGFAVHMGILAAAALIGLWFTISRANYAEIGGGVLRAPPPGKYDDEVIRWGVIATVFWGMAGFLVGLTIALQLAYPLLNFPPYFNFGRLRPLHTSAVIFAFGGCALMGSSFYIATSFYVVQRTCRARLAFPALARFVFWGYQLFIVLAATGYLMGITQGKEYAEPEWYVDIWLTVVWVSYLAVFVATLVRRSEPHIYVANWFYLSFLLTVAMLHLVNNLAIPVSFLGSRSMSFFGGVQGAMVQWWYGHNAVGFFLTAGFLGMMYYFVPKQAERPVYSYKLSIIHFWALIFLYIWAGPHHLHYTALPDWAQTLGMVFSVMLWMPSWGGMINGLMTHRSDPADVRDEPRLLRHEHLRGAHDVDQDGELAVALHQLDHRPCALRRSRLERHGDVRRAVLPDAAPVGPHPHVFAAHGELALLVGHAGYRFLHRLDVGGGHYPGPDVA